MRPRLRVLFVITQYLTLQQPAVYKMGDIVESCDLFSGLGLNAFAFRSFATPILYCDKDPAVRTILESVISRAILPAASIQRDVRSKACIIPGRARFVTASWPCQDTSVAGKRKGMEGPSGGLLTRVLKLVSSAPNVDVVFFENTPAAATNGSLAAIIDSLGHDFDCAWGRVCGMWGAHKFVLASSACASAVATKPAPCCDAAPSARPPRS